MNYMRTSTTKTIFKSLSRGSMNKQKKKNMEKQHEKNHFIGRLYSSAMKFLTIILKFVHGHTLVRSPCDSWSMKSSSITYKTTYEMFGNQLNLPQQIIFNQAVAAAATDKT